jgi:hypothetical protein
VNVKNSTNATVENVKLLLESEVHRGLNMVAGNWKTLGVSAEMLVIPLVFTWLLKIHGGVYFSIKMRPAAFSYPIFIAHN